MTDGGRPALAVLTALAALLAGAAVALACVPQPLITLHPRASGRPGARVTLEGLAFPAGDPVEVRWNGVDGPILARAVGPSLSVALKVPRVSDGLYGVVALSRPADGGVGSSASAMFQVTERHADAAASAPRSQRSSPPAVVSAPSPARRSSARGLAVPVLAAIGVAVLAIGLAAGFLASLWWRPRRDSGARPRPIGE